MTLSVFDLFTIGIGPSSSHTVGPMRAAKLFIDGLNQNADLQNVCRVQVELFGSLGATGGSHGSAKAVILGLLGQEPETVEVSKIDHELREVREKRRLILNNERAIDFDEVTDLLMHRNRSLPFHPNGMKFSSYNNSGTVLATKIFYSIGGGFVVDENVKTQTKTPKNQTHVPYPFSTGKQLLDIAEKTGDSISSIMRANELTWRSKDDLELQLKDIWKTMEHCIDRGCQSEGLLPGGLKVKRRAKNLYRQLRANEANSADPLGIVDWVTLYALAVNEENAAGGRVVTAPTNGAAGIIPAVLKYHLTFSAAADRADIGSFLLTAAAIGILYKENASISGAEVGCQGEIGSACSMAAGALTEVSGGTPAQVENAAEIAMEHNLGLTCDPVGGLVQVPCIERNAMGAITAISASRMALRGDGNHLVSLDKVIKTMRDTGRDMQEKYKETARGGLAINVIEIPVNVVDC